MPMPLSKLVRKCITPARWLLIGLVCSLFHTWAIIWIYHNPATPSWQRHTLSFPYFGWQDKPVSGWIRLVDGDPRDRVFAQVKYTLDHEPFQVWYMGARGETGVEFKDKEELIPRWAFEPTELGQIVTPGDRWLIQSNGWPFRAWIGYAHSDAWYNKISHKNALPNDRSSSISAWSNLVLFPYQPVFPGVVLSSVFYAVLLYLIVWVVRHYARRARRWHRQGLGLCPKCAYNTRGLTTCPECGEPVPERVPKRSTIGS